MSVRPTLNCVNKSAQTHTLPMSVGVGLAISWKTIHTIVQVCWEQRQHLIMPAFASIETWKYMCIIL